jgi:hypothetical protein
MAEITKNLKIGLLQTRDVNCAAAIASDSECEFLPVEPVVRFKENGEEFYVFRFKDTPRAREIYKSFNDIKWLDEHPDDWISFVKAFMHNKNRLLDIIKTLPQRTLVKKGNKIFCIAPNSKEITT